MNFIRPIALLLAFCMLVSLTACDGLLEEIITTSEESDSAVIPTGSPAESSAETDPPAPPPPLPTVEDLVAGYTYDWDPNGYTMEFGEGNNAFRIVAVDEIFVNHLIKYRDVMQEHENFGEYVLYMPSSAFYAFTELSAETDPAFFEVGNTFVLTFHTLTYSTNMKLEVIAFTQNGRRIVEELYPARGTTPTTVTYTVQAGDVGFGLHWLAGLEPMYIGNVDVRLILPESDAP